MTHMPHYRSTFIRKAPLVGTTLLYYHPPVDSYAYFNTVFDLAAAHLAP